MDINSVHNKVLMKKVIKWKNNVNKEYTKRKWYITNLKNDKMKKKLNEDLNKTFKGTKNTKNLDTVDEDCIKLKDIV